MSHPGGAGDLWEDAWVKWETAEALHHASIKEAIRQLVETGEVINASPEIYYYLRLRLIVAIRHGGDAFLWQECRPASIIPFPAISATEFAKWLLVEWARQRAIELVFQEQTYL